MGLIRLLYRSKETSSFNKNDVESLVNQARKNNIKDEITGALIYVDGYFMQVLEGESEAVNHLLYNKIFRDERHFNPKVLLQEVITKRHFPEWDMGLRILDTIDDVDVSDMNKSQSHMVVEIMKYFYVTGDYFLEDFWKSKNS